MAEIAGSEQKTTIVDSASDDSTKEVKIRSQTPLRLLVEHIHTALAEKPDRPVHLIGMGVAVLKTVHAAEIVKTLAHIDSKAETYMQEIADEFEDEETGEKVKTAARRVPAVKIVLNYQSANTEEENEAIAKRKEEMKNRPRRPRRRRGGDKENDDENADGKGRKRGGRRRGNGGKGADSNDDTPRGKNGGRRRRGRRGGNRDRDDDGARSGDDDYEGSGDNADRPRRRRNNRSGGRRRGGGGNGNGDRRAYRPREDNREDNREATREQNDAPPAAVEASA